MPLETVPNEFRNEEHQKLDELLYSFFRHGSICHLQSGEPPPMYQLLSLIVMYLPRLEQKYSDPEHGKALLAANPELTSLLRKAWSEGTFERIRNLKILRRSVAVHPVLSDPLRPEPMVTQAYKNAWNIPFRGGSATALHKIIRGSFSPELFNSTTNQIPIVQSSGMGKSRCVDEVAKLIFTIPFNLRPATDNMGFPCADHSPREYLGAYRRETWIRMQLAYAIFLKTVFTKVSEEISCLETMQRGHIDPVKNYQNLAALWRDKLGPPESSFRTALYQKISDIARCERDSTIRNIPQDNPLDPLIASMQEAAQTLCQTIGDKTSCSWHTIIVVIYFDEAHYLAEGTSPGFNAYDALCSVLNMTKISGIFAVYLSAVPVIAPLAPPSTGLTLPSSFRGGSTPQYLQAPFVECPFDIYDRPMICEGKKSLEDVCLPDFLVRFGRPLFWTLYESGSLRLRIAIVDLAKRKLTGQVSPLGDVIEDPGIGFAVFSTRILLSIEPALETARAFEAKQVASHLRVAYSIRHSEDMRSFSSSEPIVVEAAAQLMNQSRTIIRHFDAVLQSGLIPKEEHRDAVARLLLILAHDRASVKSPGLSADGRPFMTYTRPVRLLDFLRELFSEKHHDLIMKSRPVNLAEYGANLTLKSEFEHAYINFTHFMKAGDSSVVCTAAGWRGLARAHAWQCHDRKPFLNIILPIFFKTEGNKLGRKSTSAILIQIVESAVDHVVYADAEKLGYFRDTSNLLPYLVIVMALYPKVIKPKLESSQAEPGIPSNPTAPISDQSTTIKVFDEELDSREMKIRSKYTITAVGCSETVYKLLSRDEKNILENILRLAARPMYAENPREDPDLTYIRRRLEFPVGADEEFVHDSSSDGLFVERDG